MFKPDPVPNHTDSTLYFPYMFKDDEFNRNLYTPSLTDDKASTEEVNEILGEVESEMRRYFDSSNNVFCYSMGAFAAIAGTMTFFTRKYKLKENPKIAKRMYFVELGVIALCLVPYLKYDYDSTQEAKRTTIEIFNKYNPVWSEKGLRWHVPERSFPRWVELCKDYKAVNNDAGFSSEQMSDRE